MTSTIPIPQGLDPADAYSQAPFVPQPVDEPLANDGWFPDIDLKALRDQYRIRDAVTAQRLREAALFALVAVNDDESLTAWAECQQAAGFTSLGAVPAKTLGGESRLTVLYRRAVGSEVRALLIEGQRETDLTGAGQRAVSDLDPSIPELRRDRVHAIRDMLGKPRTTIDLI